MTELLPCPFCGGMPEIHPKSRERSYQIGCDNYACKMSVYKGDCNSIEEAYIAWNTRANDWQPIDTAGKPTQFCMLGNFYNGWALGKYDKETNTYIRVKYNGEYEDLDFIPTHCKPCPDFPTPPQETDDGR